MKKKNFLIHKLLILLSLLLSTAPMWAKGKSFFSGATAYSENDAAGSVYVATAANTKGGSSSAEQDSKSDGSSYPVHTYCFTAETNPGYTFAGWYDAQSPGGTLTSNQSQYNENIQTESGNNGSNKRKTINRYARWSAIGYTVTYNPQSGTVSPSSNSVTFASTYGDLPTPTRSDHEFAGWWTAGNGGTQVTASTEVTTPSNHDIYAHWKTNQSITWTQTISEKIRSNSFELNATASSGLTVTYTASPAGKVRIEGNTVICLKSCDEVTITAHQVGNENASLGLSYYAAEDVSKTFSIVEHRITGIPTASNITAYERPLSDSKLSGGSANVSGTWKWDDGSIIPPYNASKQVAVFTPNNESLAFDESDTLHCLVDVTVLAKVTPDVTYTIGDEYDVDDAAINLETEWTREGDGARSYSIVSFTPLNDKNNGAAGDPIIEGNRLYFRKAGTLVIRMDIAEGTNYNARTGLTKTITINKRENTISINGTANSYSTEMYMESTLAGGITLSATNTDYSGSAFVVTAGAGAAVGSSAGEINALYTSSSSTTGKIESNHNTGDATWTIYQPENYKYEEASATLTVNVKLVDEATNCYVYSNNTTEYNIYASGGIIGYTIDGESIKGYRGEGDPWFTLTGPGDKLYFNARKSGGDHLRVLYSTDNQSTMKLLKEFSLTSSYTNYNCTIPEGTTDICFFVKYGETYTKYYRDIYVTRKTYLNAEDVTIDRTSTNNPIYPSDGTGVGTLTIDYSLANGGDLHIYNDNPEKFTLSQTTISNVDCKTATVTINLSYESAVAGTDYAHLVIYNDAYRKEVTLTGITVQREQTMSWNVGDAIHLGDEVANAADATITPISYSSDDTDVINIVDGKLVAVAEGTATITARSEGNVEYAPKEISKPITVTSDLVQEIVWNQPALRRLRIGGSNVTLEASATSSVGGCSTNGARPITYTSANTSVVEIVNTNQIRIVGAGRTYVTASQAGGLDVDGHRYMAVSLAKEVIVNDPNAPCTMTYLYQQREGVDYTGNDGGPYYRFGDNGNRTMSLDDEPGYMLLDYKTESKGNGTMYIDQLLSTGWSVAKTIGTPPAGSWTHDSILLDRSATSVRVRVAGRSKGYHYFRNAKISLARYIDASELSTFEAKVGQSVSQDLTISYNNLARNASLTLGSNNSKFAISEDVIEGTCGDKDNVVIRVTYTPTEATDSEEETLTITDGTTTTRVTLRGTATRTDRYISWDQESPVDKYSVESVELNAQALVVSTDAPAGSVYYSLGGLSTTGTITGTTLTFERAGVAYVAAQGVADARYNTPVAVTKQFNVQITPTTISTLPVLAAVTSGAAIGDIELNGWQATNTVNGGVVEGTLAITSVDLINAGTNTVTLTFTPANTAMYSGCTGTTTITVNKVTSTATPSASNIIYGQTLNSSTLTNTGTEGTWTWKTADNTAILPAGTHEGLAVHFTPSNPNYTELDATVTLTVEKADPEVTAQATAITYGQAISASELSTATGDISGSWEWAVDEEQVLSVGDHVLKANFTSANANYNDLSNVDVTLTVNKAASEATPSAAAIKEGQKVSESVLTNSGTAGTWAWDAAVANNTPAAGTYNYTVHFTPEDDLNYTELTTTVQLQVNVPVYNFTNAKGDGNWDDSSNWEGGSVPGNNSDVIISGNLTINDSRTVGNLTIEDGASVQVVVSGNLTVTGASEDRDGYGDLVIANGGEVNVTGTLKVHDLVIASKSCTDGTSVSGQLTGESNITNVDGDVYIDITLVEGALDDSQWYGFTVPFEVDAENGVYRYENGNVVPLTWGNQYDIANYDSNKRYNTGKGWQYYRGTLNPGEFYYITLDGTYNVYRFKKKASSAISSGNTKSLNLYGANPASKDANWNPVGNPTLTYTITDYNGYVQIYQNGQSAYKAVPASEATFVVGCPFFIQAAAAGTLTLNVNEGAKTQLYAPARGEEKAFNISMQAETGGYADNIYLNTSDEADGTYRVGHDLLKAGTSKLVPQLWIAQGEDKLCVNEAELNNNNAYATLGLYAPTTGNYVLDIVDAPQDATLYLTYDGTVIWNLSESAYTLSLMKGTTANYGLQLVREARNTATGVEQVGSETRIQKFIHNGVLYINKDGVLYDAMGKKVK